MLKYVIVSVASKNKEQFFNIIETLVRQAELTKDIQLIKVEKGVRGSLFYYGLGIVIDDYNQEYIDDTDSDLYKFLTFNKRQLGQVQRDSRPYPRLFSEDDIKGFLTGKLRWKNFNYDIRFEIDDSWSQEADFRIEHDNETEEISENYTKLLWWTSALGSGSFEIFNQACNELGLIREHVTAWSILKKFVLLGHAEVSQGSEGYSWSIVPTSIVKKNKNKDEYFLVGRQTPKSIDDLKKLSLINEDIESTNFLPLQLGNIDDEILVKNHIMKIDNAALKRAEFLPDINTWISNLEEDPFISIRADVEGTKFFLFDGKTFRPFEANMERTLGFYKIEKEEAYTKYRFFNGGSWVSGPYADLRFLDAHYKQEKEILYDSRKEFLFLEQRFKWPLAYERALVLASGNLPMRALINNRSFLRFNNITRDLLDILCSKLEVNIAFI